MAENLNTAPIVKKIKKGGHGGHHGGSWKVAYADFVTAMMALFLLLWILETTTMEQRKAIADIFDNPSIIQGPGGASTALIDLGGAMDAPKGEGGEVHKREENKEESPKVEEKPDDQIREKQTFEELKLILEDTMDSNPILRDFKDQIFVDITDDGLRIQIVDQDKRPMFNSGGSRLRPYSKEVLHEVAKVLEELPNRITISGHTDASGFSGEKQGFSNWELSSDRANAARRELVAGGMSYNKVARVIGLADAVPFKDASPEDPINRRISIIILNKKTEKKLSGKDRNSNNKQLPVDKDSGTGFTRGLPSMLENIEQQLGVTDEERRENARQQRENDKVQLPNGETVEEFEIERQFEKMLGPAQ